MVVVEFIYVDWQHLGLGCALRWRALRSSSFFSFFFKSLRRLINHLPAARKREITHISFGFLYFPQITTKVTISIAYCIFSNNVISIWLTPSASGHPATSLRTSSSASVGRAEGGGEHHFMFNYSAGRKDTNMC